MIKSDEEVEIIKNGARIADLGAEEIVKHIPNFEISYNSDFRQKIADSWPYSINEEHAQNDWGWRLKYNLKKMTEDMIVNLKKEYNVPIS